jgi:hypothetical protein
MAYRCVDTSWFGVRQVQGGTGIQEFDGEVVYVVALVEVSAGHQPRWTDCALGAAESVQAGRHDKVLHLEYLEVDA